MAERVTVTISLDKADYEVLAEEARDQNRTIADLIQKVLHGTLDLDPLWESMREARGVR